jgi:eukaryotic-like serine/threonine-protein kinase
MLSIGSRLGSYEITAALGAGGMGEVYRARDTHLNRDVALKILPERFAIDPDRLARFKREAQILASLNHVNIAAIYGLEGSTSVHALVLELVDGPTLADRLLRGAIPLDDTLHIARQIAEALEAAHDSGVVHRDLKPSNIKLRPDGTVKVLDFGLAKAFEAGRGPGADATASPTITSPAVTQTGVILGTAGYMSPEQAKGKTADRRSDLWAFGCVVFEMLAGKRAFEGEGVSETIAGVLKSDVDWRSLPDTTPPSIHRLLRRCLAKEPKDRIGDASTARLEIDAARDGGARGVDDGRRDVVPVWRRASVAWSAAALLLLATIALGRLAFVGNRETPVVNASVIPADGTTLGMRAFAISQALSIALSPDGHQLAFLATSADGSRRIWLRTLDESTSRPLSGTEGSTRPFWSPDSRSVAFFSDGKLKRVDIAGGPVLTLCDIFGATAGGGTWNTSGTIVFSTSLTASVRGSLYRVSASGGTPTVLTSPSPNVLDSRDSAPFFLPDGRHFLYSTLGAGTTPAIFVGSLEEPGKTRLLDDVTNVQYASGRLLYMRGTTLVAQPFDADRRVIAGQITPIAGDVMIDPFSRMGMYSTSANGVLAYESTAALPRSQLIWFDRRGLRTGTLGEPGDYNTVNLSPDGKLASVTRRDATGNLDVWAIELSRGAQTRMTFDNADETQGVWSPDSSQIAFDSTRRGSLSLFQKSTTGSGKEQFYDTGKMGTYPTSWSGDGALLIGNTPAGQAVTGNDIWVAPMTGDRKPFFFLQTTFNETRAQFSPDQHWIAYQSNESGNFEVYVARFPGASGRVQVSASGGTSPRWRRDGKELFYVSADSKMTAIDVNGNGPAFSVGKTNPLFSVRVRDQFLGIPYDVSADGQRFLINTFVDQAPPSISLILNWPALLKK